MGTEAKRVDGGTGQGAFGARIMQLADRLAQWSDSPDGLTCTYLSPAHRAVRSGSRSFALPPNDRLLKKKHCSGSHTEINPSCVSLESGSITIPSSNHREADARSRSASVPPRA